MTWSTTEIVYEGLPLLLRRPDYDYIWQHKEKLVQLIAVKHLLDKVTTNGLPEKKYNKSLSNFDYFMCTLFDKIEEGIPFLIETFGGKRNYYYYTTIQYDMTQLIARTMIDFNVELTVSKRVDHDWSFLKTYPIELYKM